MDQQSRSTQTLMSAIHEVTRLDVLLTDGDGARLDGVSLHVVPDELFFSIEELRRLASWLALGEALRCAVATTSADLSYGAFRVGLDDGGWGLLLVGPFCVIPGEGASAGRAASRSRVPPHLRRALEDLRNYIPRVKRTYAGHLGEAVRALALREAAPLELIEFRSGPREEAAPEAEELALDDQESIRKFFQAERTLWNAIKTGNENLLREIAEDSNYFKYFKFKVTQDTLRAAKNLSIGFNEILRLAAYDGGANPILLHTLTWKYVRATESARSAEELFHLHEIMPFDFLRLVRESAGRNLSPRMKVIVDYVDLHLRGGLCLSGVTGLFGLSPQNLAYRFRKELGATFSEYVNAKRAAEAAWHLKNTGRPIKEIASLVGFSDVSYFTQVFKALQGETPKQYRQGGRG